MDEIGAVLILKDLYLAQKIENHALIKVNKGFKKDSLTSNASCI